MLSIKIMMRAAGCLIFAALFIFQACNKVPVVIMSPATPVSGDTISQIINTKPEFSILKAAAAKAGLLPLLSQPGSTFTVFAPDDAAFIASGFPMAAINLLSASTLNSILSYHIIPQKLLSTNISTNFPNVQMPSLLNLSPPLVKMSIFPSRRGNMLWANNIPVIQPDIPAINGVVHKVARVVAPPSLLLKQIIAGDTSLSFLRVAIQRADSGQVGLNRLDSVMGFGVANITVFAPDNNAFRFTLGIPDTSIIRVMPVQTVRGIIAYHLLGSRAFVVNLPTTTSPVQTFIGAVPPLMIDWTTGTLKLKGAGNGPALFNIISGDRNAVNGVLHTIDGVLRPQ